MGVSGRCGLDGFLLRAAGDDNIKPVGEVEGNRGSITGGAMLRSAKNALLRGFEKIKECHSERSEESLLDMLQVKRDPSLRSG
jgi:hypothetical protein